MCHFNDCINLYGLVNYLLVFDISCIRKDFLLSSYLKIICYIKLIVSIYIKNSNILLSL